METKISHLTLANDLNVYILPKKNSQVVLCQIWYKIGSFYEPLNKTGISHMLEHMMFKGTTCYKYGDLEKIIEKKGGKQNAFTSFDYTAYYQYWHKDNLSKSLELEADRMDNLIFNPQLFAKEQNVVKEERRLTSDDDPISFAYENLYSEVYKRSGRSHPIIGWMDDIENYEIQDLKNWYEFYAPNNANLVIVGDIDILQAGDLVEKFFLKKKKGKPVVNLQKKESKNKKIIYLKHPNANVPIGILSFLCPSFKTLAEEQDPKELYSLMLFSAILAEFEISLLKKNILRDKELVTYISSSFNPFNNGDSLFTITFASNKRLEDITDEILNEILTIQQNLADIELARILNIYEIEKIYSLDSFEKQAYFIGALSSINLNCDYLYHLEKIKNVTVQDIKDAVSKYLNPQYLTVLYLNKG